MLTKLFLPKKLWLQISKSSNQNQMLLLRPQIQKVLSYSVERGKLAAKAHKRRISWMSLLVSTQILGVYKNWKNRNRLGSSMTLLASRRFKSKRVLQSKPIYNWLQNIKNLKTSSIQDSLDIKLKDWTFYTGTFKRAMDVYWRMTWGSARQCRYQVTLLL